jgi:genome maintenance exonuclease 1
MIEKIKRVYDGHGNRFYVVTRDGKEVAKLPSVTTVIGCTADKSGLDEWRKRVGEAEADRISKLSMNRGTIMHRLIELYKSQTGGTPIERLAQLEDLARDDDEVNQFSKDQMGAEWLEEGWKFFYKFYNNHAEFFTPVTNVLAAEEFLWTSRLGGWAGTVDNISELQDNIVKVIDYKNSRKPKREEWIQDYYLQASAYWLAYWDRTGIKANGAEIWIANEKDEMPQRFVLTVKDLEFYLKEFLKRRETFREMYNI